jgi:hypothetical protein
MTLQFTITLSIGDLTAFAGGELGTNGLTFELVDFNVFADLSASGINLDIGYDGIGSLAVDNGSIQLRAELDASFYDPEQLRSGTETPDDDQVVTFSDLLASGSDLIAIDTTSGSKFDFSLPVSITPDVGSVTFDGAGTLLASAADIFAGAVDSLGVQLGSLAEPVTLAVDDFIFFEGEIAIERRTEDLVLSDGTVVSGAEFDLISANDVEVFIGANGPAGGANSVGLSASNLGFTLLLFDNAGTDYTAMTMTSGPATLGGSGLSLTMTSIGVTLNRTSDLGNANLVLDLDPVGGAGSSVTPTTGLRSGDAGWHVCLQEGQRHVPDGRWYAV